MYTLAHFEKWKQENKVQSQDTAKLIETILRTQSENLDFDSARLQAKLKDMEFLGPYLEWVIFVAMEHRLPQLLIVELCVIAYARLIITRNFQVVVDLINQVLTSTDFKPSASISLVNLAAYRRFKGEHRLA